MRKIKITFGYIRIIFFKKIAYINAVRYDMLKECASVVIYCYLWSNILQYNTQIENFTYTEMMVYILGARILAGQFNNGINIQLSLCIYNGNISNELIKPISLLFNFFAQRYGEFFIFLCTRIIPCLLLGGVFVDYINIRIINLLLSFVCLNFSIIIMFFLEFLIGIFSIYTLSFFGLKQVKFIILAFLSGTMVPFFILPKQIELVFQMLPFSSMAAMPMYIFLNKYKVDKIIQYFFSQLIWIAGLYIVCCLVYRKMILKIVVQGG